MRYSIIFFSLATVVIAAPMEMKDMKTTNTMKETKANNDFKDYSVRNGYPAEAAKTMAKANMKRDNMDVNEIMNDATIANMMRKESMMMDAATANHMKRKEMMSTKMMMDAKAANMNSVEKAKIMKRDVMMKDANMMDANMGAKQAADTSYDNYGAYGGYSNYGKYPGSVEEAAKTKKMDMA